MAKELRISEELYETSFSVYASKDELTFFIKDTCTRMEKDDAKKFRKVIEDAIDFMDSQDGEK